VLDLLPVLEGELLVPEFTDMDGVSGYSSEFNIPIGVIANFHFYQLIADKVG
jgi:hypothetical protein